MTRTDTSVGLESCIRVCTTCHAVCLETAQWCLEMGGRHAYPNHVRLLLDCADICRTSADFMLRGSELHEQTCALCAEACMRCADECERIDGDEMMAQCAEVCRSCAESCRRMAVGHI
jgi:hypothetical protein